MKKLLMLILAIVMAFSLIGCVDGTNGDNGGQSNGGYETESGGAGTGNEDDNDNDNQGNGGSNVVPPIQNGGSFGGGKYN